MSSVKSKVRSKRNTIDIKQYREGEEYLKKLIVGFLRDDTPYDLNIENINYLLYVDLCKIYSRAECRYKPLRFVNNDFYLFNRIYGGNDGEGKTAIFLFRMDNKSGVDNQTTINEQIIELIRVFERVLITIDHVKLIGLKNDEFGFLLIEKRGIDRLDIDQ